MSDAQIITILKALSDTTRLDIVRSLAKKGCETSCNDASTCSDLSQPALSHHFKKLVDAQVLTERKKGKQKYYCINETALLRAGIDITKL